MIRKESINQETSLHSTSKREKILPQPKFQQHPDAKLENRNQNSIEFNDASKKLASPESDK